MQALLKGEYCLNTVVKQLITNLHSLSWDQIGGKEFLDNFQASLMAQLVKNLPAMQETPV